MFKIIMLLFTVVLLASPLAVAGGLQPLPPPPPWSMVCRAVVPTALLGLCAPPVTEPVAPAATQLTPAELQAAGATGPEIESVTPQK